MYNVLAVTKRQHSYLIILGEYLAMLRKRCGEHAREHDVNKEGNITHLNKINIIAYDHHVTYLSLAINYLTDTNIMMPRPDLKTLTSYV